MKLLNYKHFKWQRQSTIVEDKVVSSRISIPQQFTPILPRLLLVNLPTVNFKLQQSPMITILLTKVLPIMELKMYETIE